MFWFVVCNILKSKKIELQVKKSSTKKPIIISIHVLLKGYIGFCIMLRETEKKLKIVLVTSLSIPIESNPLLAQF